MSREDLLRVMFTVAKYGSAQVASEKLGYSTNWLRVRAWRESGRGQFALQFAIDAGLHLYRTRQIRRALGVDRGL